MEYIKLPIPEIIKKKAAAEDVADYKGYKAEIEVEEEVTKVFTNGKQPTDAIDIINEEPGEDKKGNEINTITYTVKVTKPNPEKKVDYGLRMLMAHVGELFYASQQYKIKMASARKIQESQEAIRVEMLAQKEREEGLKAALNASTKDLKAK